MSAAPVAAIIRISRECTSEEELRSHSNLNSTMFQILFRDPRLIPYRGVIKSANLYLDATVQGELDLENPCGFDRIIVVFAEFHQVSRRPRSHTITYVSLPVEEPDLEDWCDKMFKLLILRDVGSKPDFLTLNPLQASDAGKGSAVFKWTPFKRAVFRFWRHSVKRPHI